MSFYAYFQSQIIYEMSTVICDAPQNGLWNYDVNVFFNGIYIVEGMEFGKNLSFPFNTSHWPFKRLMCNTFTGDCNRWETSDG